LGDDFRDVRVVEFGPRERRTIGHDFRRSGAVEAIEGSIRPLCSVRAGARGRTH
jgi:hypothetical protein